MPMLAMYDVLKIQDFVFNSNKTKENCGASIIVQKIFEEGIDIVLNGNAFKNWSVPPYEFRMLSGNPPDAEVIYVGGGNALVAFKDRESAIDMTQQLSKFVLEQSGGMLQFSVAYQEFSTKAIFQNVKEEMIKQLKTNKASKRYSYPMLGIGITRLAMPDGLPATKEENKEFYSKSAALKRKAFDDSKDYFRKKLGENYDFQTEFDKLGQKEGENYIAVVHIDGNNMGAKLEDLTRDSKDFAAAVPILREFSHKLDQTFIETFIAIVDKLQQGLKIPDFFSKFNIVDDKIIIRPIVLNGDDVTFVCAGKLGITLVEHFLLELSKRSPIKLKHADDIPISACAGVAIVKSHFPFYRAYELAEELCKSAKEKGKIVAKLAGHEIEVGSWLDYHVVYSGVTTRLPELRENAYKVHGMDPADILKFSNNGNEEQLSFTRYNLLWRPWCVIGDVDQEYKWQDLKTIHCQFRKDWTRSRLKTLRNTLIKSEQDVISLLAHYNSRGYFLPEFEGKKEPFPSNNQTPYFDALELLDFFFELEV